MIADEGSTRSLSWPGAWRSPRAMSTPRPCLRGRARGHGRLGGALGDVVVDAGYAHRVPEHWALPLRRLGAELVMDLHPNDRGTQGTFGGALCHNGNLYCPATPSALFLIEPLSRQASEEETKVHSTPMEPSFLARRN